MKLGIGGIKMSGTQIQDLKYEFEQFSLYSAPPEGTLHTFSALELTVKENMSAFIQCYGPLMKALDDKAVAAYFANWLSYVAFSLQYSVSIHQSALVINHSNLLLHLIPSDGYCRVAFSLKEWNFIQSPIDQVEREVWRKEIFTRFYRDTAEPLLSLISEISGLTIGDVWGQLPTKFNYYVEDLETKISDCNVLMRLQEDYRFLINDLPAEVFGLSRNPFRVIVRKIEHLTDPEQTVQMRNRCCYYYSTDGGNYCYTCPRLKEEERAARRLEYREQMVPKEL